MASDTFESCGELLQEPSWLAALSARQSVREEVANTITHGAGLVLSVAGTPVLLRAAVERGNAGLVAGCGVYLASLVFVYAMSFLSHACWRPRLRRRFRSLDQAAIYCYIAGTYTPFAAGLLGTEWRLLTAVMWLVALAGFWSKVFAEHRVDSVSILLYVLMGWLPTVAIPSLVGQLSYDGLWWVVLGGGCYSVGTFFLTYDRYPYFHAVWHLLVIGGSFAHYVAILNYVVPQA